MPAVPSKLPSSLSPWTTDRIIDLVQRRFNKRPCYYQIEVAKALYAGRDVIGCAPTGAGKTLSFWIPLLMAQEEKQQRILFVVSPLNVLAKQNVSVLLDAGISAIAVAAENSNCFYIPGEHYSTMNVKKTYHATQDIEKGKYEVIVTNPEILMTNDNLRKLWNVSSFTSQILGFVFDEGHCIVQWGKFRKHYLAVGIIRHIIGAPIPFYVASATLPPPLIAKISRLLHTDPSNTTQLLCSNDRPDVALMVQPLRRLASSYEDLSFLIPYNWQESMDKPKKFLVFFDNIKEAEAAVHFFQQRLMTEHHSRIAWFHSTMSQEYREAKVREFREGDIWGMFCTDAFGLVSVTTIYSI
jgi:superfamily II DNA helicase RecQ